LIGGGHLYFVSVTTINRGQGHGLNRHKSNVRYGGNCALTHVGLIYKYEYNRTQNKQIQFPSLWLRGYM